MAPGLLLAKQGEAHPIEQADLYGARLVVWAVRTGQVAVPGEGGTPAGR